MSLRFRSFKLFRFVTIIACLASCTYVCWGVSLEYFYYKTNSVIEIRDYPEENIRVPGLSICVRISPHWTGNATIGELFTGETNFFNDKNDTWKVGKIYHIRLISEETKRIKWMTKKYLLGNSYCYFLQIDNPFEMEELTSIKYIGMSKFYYIEISSDPFQSANIWGDPGKRCNSKYFYVSLVRNQSTLSNLRIREAFQEVCTKGFHGYEIGISYSSLVSIRLPPPYDSNCRDYRIEGPHLSSHECYDYCLKDKTRKWNIVPNGTLIDRDTYNRSNWYILSEDDIEYLLQDTKRQKRRMSEETLEKYLDIGKEWNVMKRSCRKSCDKPDCRSEDISPQVSYSEGVSKYGNETLSRIKLTMLLSYQPTLEVTIIPKQLLIDYIIYMASMLSFWIGFCPLTLADSIIEKLRECIRKKKQMTVEERIRRIETQKHDERVRKLESQLISVIVNQERMRSTLKRISNRV